MKKWVSLTLAMLLVMSLFATASADQSPPVSIASISFTPGYLRFENTGDMNIDFGENTLPVSAHTYFSGTPVTFSVSDARDVNGQWQVKVKRTGAFKNESQTSNFDGTLMLTDGVVVNDDVVVGGGGGESGVEINDVVVEDMDNIIIKADENQTRSIFHINWDEANITLALTTDEALSVLSGITYKETLTWTLETYEE